MERENQIIPEEDKIIIEELGLNDRMVQFCYEYIIDFNAAAAGRRAGYSGATGTTAFNLLRRNDIQLLISHLKEKVQQRAKIDVDELVDILANIARFDMADIYDENGNIKPISEIPKEARDAIESIEVSEGGLFGDEIKKIKVTGKQAAIDKLLKHFGEYDKHNKQKRTQIDVGEVDTVIFRDFSEGEDMM